MNSTTQQNEIYEFEQLTALYINYNTNNSNQFN